MVLVAISLCIGPFPKGNEKLRALAGPDQAGIFPGEGEIRFNLVPTTCLSRLQRRLRDTCLNRVPPAEPPRSFPFQSTKNAAAPHGCAASCCEWFQSAREPELRDCRVRSAADRNYPEAT